MSDQLKELFKSVSPTLKVVEHDTSTTGIRFKLRVELPIRVKTSDLSWVALDIGNALYRNKGFKYALIPSVELEGRGRKKKTVFYYFFNDIAEAERMGFKFKSDALRTAYLKHEEKMASEGYPSFVHPYRRVA